MYKWSLLLLASAAVFQPIASFTEPNLVDGRQQCCDHQPHLLRDTRLTVYGNYRPNKVASEVRRLNDHRVVPATQRYEVRSVETAPSRETESLAFRRVIAGRSARLSRFDRRTVVRIDSSDRRNRQVSQDRDYRASQIRISRDDTARVGNDQRQRSRLSLDSRREQRLLSRETTNMRDHRVFSEGRDILQKTRNDVVHANIRITRKADFLNRHNNAALFDSRRQNVRDNERESLERRVREVSESRLPLARSRMVDENLRITKENRMREVNLNRRVIKESFDARRVRQTSEPSLSESRRQNVKDNEREYRSLERRVRHISESRLPLARSRMFDENRQITRDNRMSEVYLNRRVDRESSDKRRVGKTSESKRVADSRRATDLNERGQIREDFSRQQRRLASADRRFSSSVEREIRMRTRPESTERSEKQQSRRIRENIREYHNNARDARRNTNSRLTRSVDRSFTRDTDGERRQLARSLDRRSNMAFTSSGSRSLLSREESRNMNRNDLRRIPNTRDNVRDTSVTERRTLDHQTKRDRRYTPTNSEIRNLNEDRVMFRRTSRDADVRSRHIERRMDSVTENNRRFNHQLTRTEADSRGRQDNRRTSDRRMERSRFEVRLEHQDKKADSRADTRNQRSFNRFNERSEVRQSRELERDASRTRDARINYKQIQKTRESRTIEVRNAPTAADTRDRSETRSRLTLAEVARVRREFMSKKTIEQDSFALNWQYLFYTLQGIYLCGIIASMIKEKPDSHKSRSWWGISTKAVKVD